MNSISLSDDKHTKKKFRLATCFTAICWYKSHVCFKFVNNLREE